MALLTPTTSAWVLAMAVGASVCGCASTGATDRTIDGALAAGQGHARAGNWPRTIEALRPLEQQRWAEGDQRRNRVLLLLQRAHRELGQSAEALVELDALGSDDPAVVAEREAVRRTFLESVRGPSSAIARLSIHDGLPGGYGLQSLGVFIDGRSVLWWQRSPDGGAPPSHLTVSVTPSVHVLRLEGACAMRDQTLPLTAESVLPCGESGSCEVTIDVHHVGGPLTPFEQTVAVDLRIDESPASASPEGPLRASSERPR
jgi:hypothetical protein